MVYPIDSRAGRYLGNNNSHGDKEVHSLANVKSQCQIDTILRNRHAVGFNPDTLDEVHRNGFDNCAWCIGGSTR